jgi:hypothetical protein
MERYTDEFHRKDGSAWCVVFQVPDDVYHIKIERDGQGKMARLHGKVQAYAKLA